MSQPRKIDDFLQMCIPLILVGVTACSQDTGLRSAQYVGGASCISCHPAQAQAWTGSHHDRAMQVASDSTVLGDFENASFAGQGMAVQFTQDDGEFYVSTAGPSGPAERFEVVYAFGVEPLQQYLIAMPGGRLQAFPIAWDSRSIEDGGQRWFNLYPDESIEVSDALHWTGPNQNWNYMCADCHSTNVKKGYVLADQSYQTTWSDLDVSCEACHGPGSNHLTWAAERVDGYSFDGANTGFAIQLADAQGITWDSNQQTGAPEPSADPKGQVLMATCSRCHSRRTQLREGFQPGDELLDYYRPALLRENLYFADGQIDGEVYVYGSFLQSKMYAAGVTCTNCHGAHELTLKTEGNALCTSCHQTDSFDSPVHRRHSEASAGSQCVTCHMPARTYMGVDVRRDHSFRIPNPSVSAAIKSPDICRSCHADKSAAWAEGSPLEWQGEAEEEITPAGLILHKGRRAEPGADPSLAALVLDGKQSAIRRATALDLLAAYRSVFTVQAAQAGLADPDPLVRLTAVTAMENVDPPTRWQYVSPRLEDSVRAVRIEAARVLNPIAGEAETSLYRDRLKEVVDEYIQTEMTNADRPEAHLNVGLIHLGRGNLAAAESSFNNALLVDLTSVPARVNLSDLYRMRGDDLRGESVLREAIAVSPASGEAYHALGLNLIRQKRNQEAMEYLLEATRLSPDIARFGFVYAIALQSRGETGKAVRVLEQSHDSHPRDTDILLALVTISRDRGDLDRAKRYANRLVAIDPNNAAARQILDQLN